MKFFLSRFAVSIIITMVLVPMGTKMNAPNEEWSNDR